MKISAVSALEERNSEAISLLTPFVSHEDWQINFRYRLARAIESLGDKQTQETLTILSQDSVK